jgi:hypothetical protein
MKRTLALAVALSVGSTASAQAGQPSQGRSKWSIPPAAAKKSDKSSWKPCLRYGEGFYQIPGTDTCVKVGGGVRSDVLVGPR